MSAEPGPAAAPVAAGPGRPASGGLRVAHVSRSFGATRALADVSFTVRAGGVHALLGGNGSGKSTLIKVLAGVVRAAPGGTVTVGGAAGDGGRGGGTGDGGAGDGAATVLTADGLSPAAARAAGLRFVHQDSSIFPDLTVAENLALGSGFATGPGGRIRWRAQRRRAAQVLDRFGIPARPGQAARTLRPAAQTMLAVARALQDDGDESGRVLVLDEPTAALPHREVDRLLRDLRGLAARGHTILLVSHRLDEIRDVADEFTVLRDGRHVLTDALGGRSAADLAELVAGHPVGPAAADAGGGAAGGEVLAVAGLRAGRLDGVGLAVAAGEIAGVAGLAGAGCSTLLRAVAGDRPGGSGEVRVDGRAVGPRLRAGRAAGIVLVPEQRSQIAFADQAVAVNLTGARSREYWRRGVMAGRAERRDAEAVMRAFGVVAASARAAMSSLSGGNQQKVIIAAALQAQPRVLLLDEPTQGVDVGARAAIHQMIRDAAAAGACVLVASSDLDELAELCGRVLAVRRGQVTAELAGGALTRRAILEAIQGDGSAA